MSESRVKWPLRTQNIKLTKFLTFVRISFAMVLQIRHTAAYCSVLQYSNPSAFQKLLQAVILFPVVSFLGLKKKAFSLCSSLGNVEPVVLCSGFKFITLLYIKCYSTLRYLSTRWSEYQAPWRKVLQKLMNKRWAESIKTSKVRMHFFDADIACSSIQLAAVLRPRVPADMMAFFSKSEAQW